MRLNNILKIFIILVFSTSYTFCFTFYGVKAYEHFFSEDDLYSEGTEIGSKSISNKTKNQAAAIITDEFNHWKKSTKITFNYKERSYKIDNRIFKLDEAATLSSIKNESKNTAVVDIDQDALTEQMIKTSVSLGSADIDQEKLKADLLSSVINFQFGKYTYQLEEYVASDDVNEVISKAAVKGEKFNKELETFVKEMPSIELEEKSVFSLLSYLKKEGNNDYTEETISVIATAIYGAVLPTNFTILERHISKELPSNVQLGYEAKASDKNNMDLVISNENDTTYKIEFSYEANTLSAVLRGSPFLYRYTVVKEGEKSYPPQTVVQLDAKIPLRQMVVKDPGKPGNIIKIYREVYDESGNFIKKELISEDFYAPIHRILLQSLIAPPIMDEDPPDIEVPSDEEEVDLDNPDEQVPDDDTISDPSLPPDNGDSEDEGELTPVPKQ